MKQARNTLVALAVCALVAPWIAGDLSAQQQGTNGLGMSMGTLSRLSHAKTRSISPENFTGEKGKGGMATEGTGAKARARPRAGLEDLAVGQDQAGADLHAGRHRGPGRDPAHLDDAHRPLALLHPAHVLGRRDDAVGRVPGRRFLRLRLGRLRAAVVARRVREPRQRASTATGRCRSASAARITLENLDRAGHDALLPDRLHAHRRAGRRGVLPRAVPARRTRCRTRRSTPSSTA